MDKDLYREEILDHGRNPRNKGRLENSSKQARFVNPLCGDVIELDLVLEGKPPKISQVGYETNGCVISVAASSMLSQNIKGKTLEELGNLDEEEIIGWFGGTLTSSRRDCALLPFGALREILEEEE